jgi:RimJ/RimL family protein N-acetyltransferase
MSVPEVLLRGRTEADTDTLFEVAADLATWEQRNPEPPTVLSRDTFDRRLAERDETQVVAFVVDVGGVAVGGASMFEFDPLAQHASVGIGLTAGARGRGIGTEAMRQLVRFGFERRNLRRIHLIVVASNAGAIRSYEKVGFVLEGRLREHCWVNGEWVDELRMGLLRSEWTG